MNGLNAKQRILIIHHTPSPVEILLNLLQSRKAHVTIVETGVDALSHVKKTSFDLIISNLEGIETLHKNRYTPSAPLILLAQSEINAPPLSCLDTLFFPLTKEKILQVLSKWETAFSPKKVIAESPTMKEVLKQVQKVSKSQANVFIYGESGTGKEVIASLIHEQSKRQQEPFIKVNCAAIPDTLIESEFFGHEKGAFTGAVMRRIGKFELADKGTLLLDEISEIPMQLQAKLLRAVQEQEIERIGGHTPICVNLRIISTSNRNMQDAIKEKLFREDLYFRLNVVPIFLPPLRERREDILPLAEYFLVESCRKNQKPLKILSEEVKQKLLGHPWPGNIRELANIIERAVVIASGQVIEIRHLLIEQKMQSIPKKVIQEESQEPIIPLKELEKQYILQTLKFFRYNKTKTAKALGISLRTLRNKLTLYTKGF